MSAAFVFNGRETHFDMCAHVCVEHPVATIHAETMILWLWQDGEWKAGDLVKQASQRLFEVPETRTKLPPVISLSMRHEDDVGSWCCLCSESPACPPCAVLGICFCIDVLRLPFACPRLSIRSHCQICSCSENHC